jgi:hypothetical protein
MERGRVNPSELRHAITIRRPTKAVDAAGQPTGATTIVFQGRAAIKDIVSRDTREENRNEKRVYVDSKHFTIRRCKSYTPQPIDKIVWQEQEFDIYQIIDPSTVTRLARHNMYWQLSAEARS